LAGKRDAGTAEADKNKKALVKCDNVSLNTSSLNVVDKKNGFSVVDTNFSIIYTNADCLTNKLHELNHFINSLDVKPTVVVITEVNAKSSSFPMQEHEFNIDGYIMHSINIGVNKCRGIIIYVDRNVNSSSLDLNCKFSEFLCVNIRDSSNSTVTICAVYRSPNSDKLNDNELFNLLSIVKTSSNGKIIILGDFNYCNINWNTCTVGGSISGNTQGHKFLSSLSDNFLIQHVLFPTRVRGNQTPHILDLVLTFEDFIEKITDYSPLGKSDHCVLHIHCNLNYVLSNNSLDSVKHNYNKGSYEELSFYVSNFLDTSTSLSSDFSSDFDVNSYWINLKQTLREGINNCIPCYSNNSWMKRTSWKYPIDSGARKLIKDKHRLWKRYLRTRDPVLLNEYKNVRNLVRKESRNTVQNIQKKVALSCKTNPKSFWNFIKSKGSVNSGLSDIKISQIDNTCLIIKEDQEKAEAFVEHFSKIFTIENNLNFTELPTILPPNSMPEVTFTEVEVHKQLSSLKIDKSPGPDLLHPRVLYELRDVLVCPLTHLFRQSMIQGIVPEDWKMSTVTPVYKNGKKDSMNNYRPISLTCIACKIMESIVRNKRMDSVDSINYNNRIVFMNIQHL